MMQKIVFAGFGGQGIMVMGELLAYSAMLTGKQVTYIPSYGPEMRGGTANCSIVISDEPISSPIITEPSILVAMNGPSLTKFEDSVKPSGIVFVNGSLIKNEPLRDDIAYITIDCSGLAKEIMNEKLSNMVMLGALIKKTKMVPVEAVYEAMDQKFTGGKARFIPANRKALGAWTMEEN